MKRIEIIVSPAGESTVQTHGFRGDSCREASKFIEQTLGKRTSETLTAEYHQQERASHEAREES